MNIGKTKSDFPAQRLSLSCIHLGFKVELKLESSALFFVQGRINYKDSVAIVHIFPFFSMDLFLDIPV